MNGWGGGEGWNEMKWNEIVKESKMINTKQIISWYTISKGMVQRATNTCIWFRNIAAFKSDTERLYILPSTSSVIGGLSRWTWRIVVFSLPTTKMKRHKFLVFLSKLFLNLHFSSFSNRWKRGHLFVFPQVLPFDGLLTWTNLAHIAHVTFTPV